MASTRLRQRTLFTLSYLISPQVMFILLISSCTDLLQLLLGLPLFLWPCGSHSNASLSIKFCFLSVCPIQFHLCFKISWDIGIWSVLVQSSWFVVTSGQMMFNMRRRQLFTKHSSLLFILLVTRQVHRCRTGGSMRACHAAGPGSIPGRDKFPGWGFSSPIRQMSGSFRPQGPRISFGHYYHP